MNIVIVAYLHDVVARVVRLEYDLDYDKQRNSDITGYRNIDISTYRDNVITR